ncbi:hypothetical protein DFP72DRAFT_927112, partial [Ephemerocybe angulata]
PRQHHGTMHVFDDHCILHSNDVPTSVKAEGLAGEILQLTALAHKLQSELEEVQNRLSRRRGALSAIRRIPQEILGEIFSSVLGAPVPLDLTGRNELLDLGLVCRRWREATLLTHQLWCGLTIASKHMEGSQYDKIATWLGRSGGVPKSLRLCAPDDQVLGREPDSHLSDPTTRRLLTQGPILDHLFIECETAKGMQDLKDWIHLNDAGNPRSTLGRLHFRVFDIPPYLLQPRAPQPLLQGLTSFEITCNWEGPVIPVILQHCSNVERLTVDLKWGELLFEEGIVNAPFPQHGIRLPKLRSLGLRRHINSLRILDHLHAPLLESLDIGMEGYEVFRDWDAPGTFLEPEESIRRFLQRSKCQSTLHSLRFYCIYLQNPDDLLGIIASSPSLTHLIFDRCTFVLQIAYNPLLSVDEVIFDALQFLHYRGPQKCQFVTSFRDAPVFNRTRDVAWRWKLICECDSRRNLTLEEFGIDYKIVPAVDHGDIQ